MTTATTPRVRKELRIEDITAIVDTREQTPFDLAPLKMERGTLATGDYSIRGLEQYIAIERKSLPDLLACCGVERERFEREVQRLLAYPVRALIVGCDWADLMRGDWRSQIKPQSVMGSVLAWTSMGLPVVLAGNHDEAGQCCSRLLFIAARRRWRESLALAESVLSAREEAGE